MTCAECLISHFEHRRRSGLSDSRHPCSPSCPTKAAIRDATRSFSGALDAEAFQSGARRLGVPLKTHHLEASDGVH
jgi:hypothetical protein